MATFGFGGGSGGTEFLTMLPPPHDAVNDWDNTKPYNQQSSNTPQIFRDAMSVREEVYGEQGVPLEAEFDEDDRRSFHWVVYASVATTSSPPPDSLRSDTNSNTAADDARRSSSTAQRLPVGTIRLVPPPHKANPYKVKDKHPDADPPGDASRKDSLPKEPYIKLGRLAVLAPYRRLHLSGLLVNAALQYATEHPENIRPPPSPTRMERVQQIGKELEEAILWRGLAMVHAQVSVERLWVKYGFSEELRDENGNVEVQKEERWWEEGIEHMGMWKRLKLDSGRL
ncbi:hypothetical protein BDV96DRAFT_610272 [Lophiotrema nucula]|uniref:Uncharacterized protein n=1 Tax=Lophiotrema nucula TaxID=690887 RepID=A0A6A5ZMS0_9PLEO|nr:hypothetical protein BDV96DRAFT_610272 [Lophiotrema nucula]